MGSILRDLQYGFRVLLHDPGFTTVAVLTLAVGVEANTTIFSVVNTILLRPLRLEDPDRLVAIYETNLKQRGRRNPTLVSQEIGIRLASGARSGEILKQILPDCFKITVIDVGMGLVGAVAVTRLWSGYLLGITPLDPLIFVDVSVALTAVALLACYIPARWASRIDPVEALRHE